MEIDWGNDFEGSIVCFGKWKGEQARDEIVKDVNCQILRDGVEVRRRLAENAEQVLKIENVKNANIDVDGDKPMPALEELNERAISPRK